MENQSLSAQLQLLLKALSNSAILLYYNYTLSFKLSALLLIAYISFRFGRLTITDPIETDAKKLAQNLQNRELYTILLPQKIKRLGFIRKLLLTLAVLTAVCAFSLYYMQHQLLSKRTQEQLKIGGLILLVLPAISLLVWFYEMIISFKINRGGFNDRLIHQKVSDVLKMLGKKPQFLLKSFLCSQKYQSKIQKTVNVCTKKDCKQQRQLYKQKYQDISRLVEGVIGFDWCSICRKRPQFDEFLSFQGKQFNRRNVGGEQQQVTLRNEFLLGELQRMVKWVNQINPCNCSRRYWSQSTKSIFQFKERDKFLSQKLVKLQKSKRA